MRIPERVRGRVGVGVHDGGRPSWWLKREGKRPNFLFLNERESTAFAIGLDFPLPVQSQRADVKGPERSRRSRRGSPSPLLFWILASSVCLTSVQLTTRQNRTST